MSKLHTIIDETVSASYRAFGVYRKKSGLDKKQFLYNIAEEIYNLGDVLIQTASEESHLPLRRFVGERDRTCGHFKAFADYIHEGSWVEATIDYAEEERPIGRKPDMRKMLLPLGPIVVFGASNFPLAYSASGGDTASALASGCTVIVKGHPAHPKTSELIRQAIHKACDNCGISRDVFKIVQGSSFEIGKALVMHPQVAGVGFTGSLSGGRALYDYAQQRETPIPVFSEMGSTNPVLLMTDKIKHETEKVAQILSKSITMGVGQFCTKPGLILGVKSEYLDKFKYLLTQSLAQIPAYTLLNEGIFNHFKKGISLVTEAKGVQYLIPFENFKNNKTHPVLAVIQSHDFLENPQLKDEIFGPYSLIIECDSIEDMLSVWKSLSGQLTTTFMATESDIKNVKTFMDAAELIAGRIVFNSEPTGVEVSHATVHGGPYPATTDSRFTSVGMDAIKRWVRPVCYQDCPKELLPVELNDNNPLKIWRKISGVWQR